MKKMFKKWRRGKNKAKNTQADRTSVSDESVLDNFEHIGKTNSEPSPKRTMERHGTLLGVDEINVRNETLIENEKLEEPASMEEPCENSSDGNSTKRSMSIDSSDTRSLVVQNVEKINDLDDEDVWDSDEEVSEKLTTKNNVVQSFVKKFEDLTKAKVSETDEAQDVTEQEPKGLSIDNNLNSLEQKTSSSTKQVPYAQRSSFYAINDLISNSTQQSHEGYLNREINLSESGNLDEGTSKEKEDKFVDLQAVTLKSILKTNENIDGRLTTNQEEHSNPQNNSNDTEAETKVNFTMNADQDQFLEVIRRKLTTHSSAQPETNCKFGSRTEKISVASLVAAIPKPSLNRRESETWFRSEESEQEEHSSWDSEVGDDFKISENHDPVKVQDLKNISSKIAMGSESAKTKIETKETRQLCLEVAVEQKTAEKPDLSLEVTASEKSDWDSPHSSLKVAQNFLNKPDRSLEPSLKLMDTPDLSSKDAQNSLDIPNYSLESSLHSLEKINEPNLLSGNLSEASISPKLKSLLSTNTSKHLTIPSQKQIRYLPTPNENNEFNKNAKCCENFTDILTNDKYTDNDCKGDGFYHVESQLSSLTTSFSDKELIFLPTTVTETAPIKLHPLETRSESLDTMDKALVQFQLGEVTSSKIFGNIESVPKLGSNSQELKTLFEAEKLSFEGHKSSSSFSWEDFPTKIPAAGSKIPNNIFPSALRDYRTSEPQTNLKTDLTKSNAETSLFRVSNPIPFSSLLKDSVEVLKARLENYSTEIPSNKATNANSYNIAMRKSSWPISKIENKPLSRRFSLQEYNWDYFAPLDGDLYDKEMVNMILDQTKRILLKNVGHDPDPELEESQKFNFAVPVNSDYDINVNQSASEVLNHQTKISRASEHSTTDEVYIKVGESGRYLGLNDDCCDPSTVPYTLAATAKKEKPVVPYQRVCESIPPGIDPNPKIIGDIISDLHCVFEKTFGQRRDIESRYRNIQCEFEELQRALSQCECCKEELQQEIIRLQAELCAAQCAFQEEAQRRSGLESMVTKLRAQLGRLEALSDADMQEKVKLCNTLREMELKMKQMADVIACLQAERDQLLKNCRGFDDWKGKQVDNLSMSKGRCDQLEDALAKCCKANEDLEREVAELRNENDCLRVLVEQLQNEKKRMAGEFDLERQRWNQERERFEQTIADLRKVVDCLTVQNQQICQKMNEVVSAHHAEMDSLRKDAEKYRMLYECEKAQREKLEKALQDCEERKREMIMQQQFQMQQQSASSYRDPCAELLNKINSDRSEYNQDLKFRLDNGNYKIAGMEKDLLYTQTRLQEKTTTHERTQQELQGLQTKHRELELDVMRAHEETVNLRAVTETLTATNIQLKRDLDAQIEKLAIQQVTEAQKEDNLTNNNRSGNITLEFLKKEYEESLIKAQLEVKELCNQITKSEISVATAELERKNWEVKYDILKKEKDDLERKFLELQPVSSEAQFYKRELERYQSELKEREEKLGKMRTLLHSAEESLKDSENRLSRVLEKDKDLPNLEAVIAELREKLRYSEIERVRFEQMSKSFEARFEYIQPRFNELFEQKKALEERLQLTTEENRRLSRNVEEEKVTRDLFQRELKDAQSLWESEVKAKGILAEKIAKSERMSQHIETKNKQELSDLDRFRDKFRQLKTELKAEREQVAKLKYKIDIQREQLRAARDHLQELANEPKVQRLIVQIDQMKAEHEKLIANLTKDRDGLVSEIYRLEQEKSATERGLRETRDELQSNELNKEAIQELLKRKDRLEKEVQELRVALKERYVDRSDIDRWKAAYEAKFKSLKAEYTVAAEKQVSEKLVQYQTYLDRQTRDRSVIDELRDANENVLRTEYSQVTNSMKSDLTKLKALVREREEEISSLKLSITHLKHKYSSEANMKEELLKQLQVLAASKTSIPSTKNRTPE